jgi:hypothetical protein
MMPSKRCLRISVMASRGKRASASTAVAFDSATAAAARARPVRSLAPRLRMRTLG